MEVIHRLDRPITIWVPPFLPPVHPPYRSRQLQAQNIVQDDRWQRMLNVFDNRIHWKLEYTKLKIPAPLTLYKKI